MTHTEAVNTLASERYLLEEMNELERDAFEAHYFECSTCANDVTIGAKMQEGVKAGLLATPHVAHIASFAPAKKASMSAAQATITRARAWYQSAAIPWAVAATLAVMVGYQTQNGHPAPASAALTTEVVTPLLLAPASRGAASNVSLARPQVALALDVDADGAQEVSYELHDAANAVLSRGRTAAPPMGAPLVVVIPSFTLKPEERYSLIIRDATQADRTLGEYSFTAVP